MTDQIAKTTQRLAQLKARQLLADMRAAAKAKEMARKADYRKRLALGSAVIAAGCGEWEPEQVVGLMAEGRKRYDGSATVRAWLRQQGAEHLVGTKG